MSHKASKSTPTSKIEEDLTAGQDRLAEDINELIARFHPKSLLTQGKHKVKTVAKGFFVADNGEMHVPRIAMVSAAVVGVIALVAGGRK